MRKAQIAEWILSLVTTSERAEATVGDLIEATPGRRARSFWASVASTVLSFLWHDLAADPWRLTALALRALLVAGVFLAMSSVVLFGALFGVMLVIGTSHVPPSVPILPVWVGSVAGIGLTTVAQFMVGRWIARRAPAQELVACTALILLEASIGLALDAVWPSSMWEEIMALTVYQIPSALPLLAGAISIRRGRGLLAPS